MRSSIQALSLINSTLICPHFLIVCSSEVRNEIRITSLGSKCHIFSEVGITVLKRNVRLRVTFIDEVLTRFIALVEKMIPSIKQTKIPRWFIGSGEE